MGVTEAIGFAAAAIKAKVVPLLTKPARDLTKQEAFDLFMFLVDQDEIELLDAIHTRGDKLISPQPGQQVNLGYSMGGVDYLHVKMKNSGPSGSAGAARGGTFQPTIGFAIVLYRFARALNDAWGATEIVWGGVGTGGGRNESDCHSTGNCVDFYGAKTSQGFFDVRKHWSSRTVYRKDTGKPHSTKAADPDAWDHWGDETNTYFRLAASKDAQDGLPTKFFGDVYGFAREECTIGAGDVPADQFRGGSPLGYGTIFHPDHPKFTNPGRREHEDHVHFQLGVAVLKK